MFMQVSGPTGFFGILGLLLSHCGVTSSKGSGQPAFPARHHHQLAISGAAQSPSHAKNSHPQPVAALLVELLKVAATGQGLQKFCFAGSRCGCGEHGENCKGPVKPEAVIFRTSNGLRDDVSLLWLRLDRQDRSRE